MPVVTTPDGATVVWESLDILGWLEGDSYDPLSNRDGAAGCKGSWRPEDFGVFLYRTNLFEKQVQSKWGRRLDYNEIIVNGAHWTDHLPHTIEAFFQTDEHGRGRKNDRVAQEQHAKFLRTYGLKAEQIPLLAFNSRDWSSPFSTVSTVY